MQAELHPHDFSLWDLLFADHDHTLGLLECLNKALTCRSPLFVIEEIVRQIYSVLSIQRVVEQEVLYPRVCPDDHAAAKAFLLSAELVAFHIASLRRNRGTRLDKNLAIYELQAAVFRNLYQREEVLMPLIQRSLTQPEIGRLTTDFYERKKRLLEVASAAHMRRVELFAGRKNHG
jgi:hypothetical protein